MTADKTLIRALLIDNDAGDRAYLGEQLDKAISVNFELTETPQLDGFTEITGANSEPFDVIMLSLALPVCKALEAL